MLNAIPQDAVENILAWLPNQSLTQVTKAYPDHTNTIVDQNFFWKMRVETLVEKYLPDFIISDWKGMHDRLAKSKEIKDHFEYSEDVSILLYIGVDPRDNNNFSIQSASARGYDKVVKVLLENGRSDPSAGYNFSIQMASAGGYDKVVKLLLADNRVDPSSGDNYAIQRASSNGHDKVVKLLLEDGRADPTTLYNHPIRQASMNGHDKVVKLLLEDGRADPSADDNRAIRRASANGHDKVVELLLEDGRAQL